MIKLALLGKSIQHSKSPSIYREMLGQDVSYDLLDYAEESLIPKPYDLLNLYDGISITSPYKKHFLKEVALTYLGSLLGAINCLKLKNGIIYGENTDFPAIMKILERWMLEYKNLNIIILGDGVMSNVTQLALKVHNIPFKMLSRKNTKRFDQLNLPDIYNDLFPNSDQRIVINTCSRNFIFKGIIDKSIIFWDYNYDFTAHLGPLSDTSQQYIDGHELLKLQAKYALSFWSIKPI